MAASLASGARAAPPLGLAKVLSLIVPAALLAGAFAFEHFGGLYPCEMCWWQRWAHMAALAFALLAVAARGRGRIFVVLAALAILASGLIGGYHAGVEAGIFQGFTQCTQVQTAGSAEELMAKIMAAPLVRCDQVPWSLFGISMAGWNAILSLSAALVILWLTLKRAQIRR